MKKLLTLLLAALVLASCDQKEEQAKPIVGSTTVFVPKENIGVYTAAVTEDDKPVSNLLPPAALTYREPTVPLPPVVHEEPSLFSNHSAEGDLAEGSKKIKGLKIPDGSTIEPVPQDSGRVKVEILCYSFLFMRKMPYDEVVAAQMKKLTDEEVIRDLTDKGYRPATLEEFMAVRPKFADVEGAVLVLGSTISYKDQPHTVEVKYGYVLGTDIVANYGEGLTQVGLRPPGRSAGLRKDVMVAVVKNH